VVQKRYPGELCNNGDDCLSSKCIELMENHKKVCEGIKEDGTCEGHGDCNPGLYCKKTDGKSVCKQLISLSEPCEESAECDNGVC
jgi:hypothetical protein